MNRCARSSETEFHTNLVTGAAAAAAATAFTQFERVHRVGTVPWVYILGTTG